MPQGYPFAVTLVAGVALSLVMGSPIAAQEDASGAGTSSSLHGGGNGNSVQDVQPLTSDSMEAFIASIPTMRMWTDQYNAVARVVAPKVLNPSVLSGNPFALIVAELRGSDAYDAMNTAVAQHGFETPEAWASVADRVTKALGVLAGRSDEAASALALAQRGIEDNPGIPDDERMKLKGLLMALNLFANAPRSDVAAVAPYTQRIIEALRASL